MARKSLLEQLGASGSDVPDEPLEAVPEILSRRPKPSRAGPKRNRDWEARQRGDELTVVTYRGIPLETRDAIKAIAQTHGVTANDVARLFLEYALSAHERGAVTLSPRLHRGRLTLFPPEEARETA